MAACLAGVTAAAGCGGPGDRGGGDRPPRPAAPVGSASGGSVVQYADCGDWRAGSAAARRATVVALRGQLTPQTSRTAKSPLRDQRAYEILDKACRPAFAKTLRLYKLYVRAQAFAPLSD